MAKPLVEYPDPELVVVNYFDTAYADLADRAPATITTGAPQQALAGEWWLLQVEADGSFTDDHPATLRATVRVNCHAAPGRRSDVKAHAMLAFGLLAAHPGDDDVWGTAPLVGPSGVITDAATKNLMCWFTFRVNLRPSPVSL